MLLATVRPLFESDGVAAAFFFSLLWWRRRGWLCVTSPEEECSLPAHAHLTQKARVVGPEVRCAGSKKGFKGTRRDACLITGMSSSAVSTEKLLLLEYLRKRPSVEENREPRCWIEWRLTKSTRTVFAAQGHAPALSSAEDRRAAVKM